jgi:hypothetical protein
VTVLVTISRTCLIPLRLVFGLLTSKYRPLSATSQSYGLLAPKGDLTALVALIGFVVALIGLCVSFNDHAGDAGMWRRMRPVEGAEVG